MHRAIDRRAPRPRRGAAVGALSVVLLVLSGCGSPGSGAGADDASAQPPVTASDAGRAEPATEPPSAAPDRRDGAVRTDIPVSSARLEDAALTAPLPPVSLAIASLGITVPVDPVGVQPDGQMEIPPLAERAGWYRFGSSPADGDGTAVIAAHVDSVASAGLGPFARLPEARVGDVVDVTLADGVVRQYAVTVVERRAKPEVVWSEVFVRDGGSRLVLVTCGGTFQRDVRRYSDNVIVIAEAIGPPQPLSPGQATGGG